MEGTSNTSTKTRLSARIAAVLDAILTGSTVKEW